MTTIGCNGVRFVKQTDEHNIFTISLLEEKNYWFIWLDTELSESNEWTLKPVRIFKKKTETEGMYKINETLMFASKYICFYLMERLKAIRRSVNFLTKWKFQSPVPNVRRRGDITRSLPNLVMIPSLGNSRRRLSSSRSSRRPKSNSGAQLPPIQRGRDFTA